MKNLKILLMLFLISSGILVFNSCSKENKFLEQDRIQLNDGITITDGILTFATVDLYDETIQLLGSFNDDQLDSWEKSYNYSSLRSLNETPDLVYEIGNTFATLLNPQKEIIIAGNYFNLDFVNETVTKQKLDESCELKSTANDESYVFNFNDEVDIFDENPLLKSSSYSCPYEGRLWIERNTLVNGHADYRLKYDSYLIYKYAEAEIEAKDAPSVEVWITANSSENKYNRRNLNGCTYAGDFWGHDDDYQKWTIYHGTRALSAYKFKVTFKARSQTYPYDDLDTWVVSLDCQTVEDCPY